MLNGKYIIIGAEYPPVVNPYAYGNAWFVSSAVPAATPDEEIALLAETDLRNTAVIGNDFAAVRSSDAFVVNSDSNDRKSGEMSFSSSVDDKAGHPISPSIELTYYAPNELRYSYDTDSERAAIFSEIYYPKGWKAWIEPAGAYGEVRNGHYQPTADSREIELFRADWMLRGAIVPEGKGQIIMRFEPDSYQIGEDISRASSITLILLLLLSVGGVFWERSESQRKTQA